MKSEADKAIQLSKIMNNLTPLKDRRPLVSSIGKFAENPAMAYGRLINEWIPGQPDSENLMTLFILLDFNLKAFVLALSGRITMSINALEESRGVEEKEGK